VRPRCRWSGGECIDLYLLHWRGAHPLRETVLGMLALVAAGSIRHWGVSNLDVDALAELAAVTPAGAAACATNQVYYSLSERGPEFSLLPWMCERRMPLMAYSPVDQGRLAGNAALARIGEPRGLTAAQVALAWVLSQPGIVAIPKAAAPEHLRQNFAAAEVSLSAAERARIEARFAAPKGKTPLAML